MTNYKSQKELELFRQNELFTIKEEDYAEFYNVPLQGFELLSKVSINHLMLVVTSKGNNNIMSMGFYPTDGDIMDALFIPKKGFVWNPDLHYIPTNTKFNSTTYHKTSIPIKYDIECKQAKILNNILGNSGCKLKDGSKSRGVIKRDRIECSVKYKYSPLSKNGCKNCVTWLYHLFPNLNKDINGK